MGHDTAIIYFLTLFYTVLAFGPLWVIYWACTKLFGKDKKDNAERARRMADRRG